LTTGILAPARVDAPVPPLAIGSVPVTPVDKGSPVAFVKVPLEGVPKTGVVKVGLVSVLLVSVSVVALPTNVSVLVGSVNVPVLLMLEIIGAVSVLLVNVCVSVVPTGVPEGIVMSASVLALVIYYSDCVGHTMPISLRILVAEMACVASSKDSCSIL